jgi:putative membrane protein
MRLVPLLFGCLSLAVVWLTPLLPLARGAFWAHMTVHMTVVAVAAPLLALGVAGGPWDPVRRTPSLFPPLPASLLELAVVWLWHTPTLHSAARSGGMALLAEQATFLLSGLVLWLAVFGGDPRSRPARAASGVVALLLTLMHMTLLGALLALSPRPLYDHLHGGSTLTPLEDQHLGGAIMLLAGGASYLIGGVWLTLGLLRREAH